MGTSQFYKNREQAGKMPALQLSAIVVGASRSLAL